MYGIIMFQALLYFRRKWYEVFLVAHIVLAIFWTVGLWYHVQYRGYVWLVLPSIAVWVLIGRLDLQDYLLLVSHKPILP